MTLAPKVQTANNPPNFFLEKTSLAWRVGGALFADVKHAPNFEILLQKLRFQLFEIKLQSKICLGLLPCVVLKPAGAC